MATAAARGQAWRLSKWLIPIAPVPITAQRSLSAIVVWMYEVQARRHELGLSQYLIENFGAVGNVEVAMGLSLST